MSDFEATKIKPSTDDITSETIKNHNIPLSDQTAKLPIRTPTPIEEVTPDNDSPKNNSSVTALKKKELMRPLFSRTSTTEKSTKQISNKSMIVETETVDASNTTSVTLPIVSSSTVVSNVGDLKSTTANIAKDLASLRTRKSTIFADQTNQGNTVGASSQTSTTEDDNSSVNGSVRNFNKRLNPAESQSHLNIQKSGATKADLFAAKIANAVGDASDTDSEETFVYESAPDVLNSSNTLPAKTPISALGCTNPMALRKLSQRNISMPVTSVARPHSPSTATNTAMTNDDPKDPISQIFDTENDSDISNRGSQNRAHQITAPTTAPHEKLYIMKSSADLKSNTINANSTSNTITNNPNSSSTKSLTKSFTKYHGDTNNARRVSNTAQSPSLLPRTTPQNQLRTTTSKLFDVKGSSLRRYSGVPDDINIEDYIDQYDEEHGVRVEPYSDTYDYEDYEEEDELTPLNVSNANNNLRSKMNHHYFNRRSLPNFRSTDNGSMSPPFGHGRDLHHTNSKFKNKKYRTRSYHQQNSQPYSPHNFRNTKRNRIQALKNFVYVFILVLFLLAFGFIAGFLLATTKDLQNVQITSVDNLVISYDELIFDLKVKAFNPGFVAVEINDLELDIFAKSSHLDKETVIPIYEDGTQKDPSKTILLGTIVKFESPLEFASGFLNRNFSYSRGQIKLLHPGQNATDEDNGDGVVDKQSENHKIENDSDKWKTIMNHPFDLILRGTFKYDLPFYHNERSVAVTKTIAIDPATAI